MKSKNEVIYIDEEINALEYNFALKYDKRDYCNYYISLLKTKHNLIFAFCNNMDYNSKIIKIDLFVIGFVIDFAINTLFYDDETMHNIYKSKGNFDFETQIPIIVYSTLISMVLNVPLNFLALSNDAILSFKQEKIKINIKKRAEDLKYKLNIKFIIYFIISFLLLDFFWYYISMFCAIYKNTQIHLLKDTLYSFGLSLLFPFVIYLIQDFLDYHLYLLVKIQENVYIILARFYNLFKLYTYILLFIKIKNFCYIAILIIYHNIIYFLLT